MGCPKLAEGGAREGGGCSGVVGCECGGSVAEEPPLDEGKDFSAEGSAASGGTVVTGKIDDAFPAGVVVTALPPAAATANERERPIMAAANRPTTSGLAFASNVDCGAALLIAWRGLFPTICCMTTNKRLAVVRHSRGSSQHAKHAKKKDRSDLEKKIRERLECKLINATRNCDF